MNGKGGTLDSEAVTVKYQFNYGSLPTPEKSDRVFEGWYTTSNFEDDTKVTDGSIVRNSEDHVLYARYQIPVTFVGTDNQTLMVSYAFEDQPTGITAPSKKPGKEGYTFMCWADASGQEYDFTQPVTKPVTLKPKFFQYRYIGNENIWYLDNVGVSTFPFKRFEIVNSERESDMICSDPGLFFTFWTRKEAWGKCEGCGLGPALLKDFSDISGEMSASYKWSEYELPDGYALCVCEKIA